MFRKATIITLISLAVLVAGCNKPAETSQTSYKIGAILPLSGPASILGQSTLKGMRLAEAEINQQGGIRGNKLLLLTQDDEFDNKKSVNAASYLIETAQIDIGSVLFELPARAVNPVFQTNQTPLVYEAYVRDLLDNPYAFKTHFDAVDGCRRLTEYAKENYAYNTLGVLMANVGYNDLCLASMRQVEPDIKEYRYTFGEKDFKTYFARAQQDGADRLMTIGIDFEYVAMFKQLTELGYPIKMMCATANECIFPDVVDNSSSQVLDKTLAIDFVAPDIAQSSFGEKMRARYGDNLKPVDYMYGAVGYEDIQIMAKAFESCQPGERECMRETLENVKDYNSVIGSRGFKDRVLQLDYQIYEWQEGEWREVE